MRYISTRGQAAPVAAQTAILRGLAPDGGLYVPESFPAWAVPADEWTRWPYAELAFEILRLYLADYDEAALRGAIRDAYAVPGRFGHEAVAPLVRAGDTYYLELFHGPTLAFKDMALSLLPGLMEEAVRQKQPGLKTLILTATSGDTGKAALEAFSGRPGAAVCVFYPTDGVSDIQRLQMTTQEGGNTLVFGVRGNFDDAQRGVKAIFSDARTSARLAEKGWALSSANSINVGRLLPQIVYYFYAYAQLVTRGAVEPGAPADFTVPTGNFGNILAGDYARRMGLPVRRLVCASNANNVLTDFFRTGRYDLRRAFTPTMSPSMDILVSSNLERLLYHACGDGAQVRRMMADLARQGFYDFEAPDWARGFSAAYADEDETRAALRDAAREGYVCDPHTAVAYAAMRKVCTDRGVPFETGLNRTDGYIPNVILATASPFKFAADVAAAIAPDAFAGDSNDAFAAMRTLSAVSGRPVPERLRALREKPVRHTRVCAPEDMARALAEAFAP